MRRPRRRAPPGGPPFFRSTTPPPQRCHRGLLSAACHPLPEDVGLALVLWPSGLRQAAARRSRLQRAHAPAWRGGALWTPALGGMWAGCRPRPPRAVNRDTSKFAPAARTSQIVGASSRRQHSSPDPDLPGGSGSHWVTDIQVFWCEPHHALILAIMFWDTALCVSGTPSGRDLPRQLPSLAAP